MRKIIIIIIALISAFLIKKVKIKNKTKIPYIKEDEIEIKNKKIDKIVKKTKIIP